MSDPTTPVVTRFAPSPTGYLHIGGARTALYNWAYARRHGGKFILRLEDTDAARSSVESAKSIIEDLQWLGIDWDYGPDPKSANPIESNIGPTGPYAQSKRLAIYNEKINQLVREEKAYEKDGAIVFKMPRKDITVHDLILGDVTTPADKIIDLVIKKSDGFPTFHFANVIDDATMGVTHVIRAQEHLNNTHKHLALFEALGIKPPQYAHIPLIFNADGTKMSKRDKAKAARNAAKQYLREHSIDQLRARLDVPITARAMDFGPDTDSTLEEFIAGKSDSVTWTNRISFVLKVDLPEIDVHDFLAAGYLSEALCNYLSLLGWSPGGDVEKFDRKWLAENFSLDGIGKSNAKFDREKLSNFNSVAIQSMPLAEFAGHLTNQFAFMYFKPILDDPTKLLLFAEAYRARAKTLKEPFVAGRFFITPIEEIAFETKAVEKVLKGGEGYAALEKLLPVLEAITDWSPEPIENTVKQFAETSGLGLGKVAQPIRVAVTGNTVSPPIGATLAILGKDQTLTRIRRCLAQRS